MFHQVQLRILNGQLESALSYLRYSMTGKHITETIKCLVTELFLKNQPTGTSLAFEVRAFLSFS